MLARLSFKMKSFSMVLMTPATINEYLCYKIMRQNQKILDFTNFLFQLVITGELDFNFVLGRCTTLGDKLVVLCFGNSGTETKTCRKVSLLLRDSFSNRPFSLIRRDSENRSIAQDSAEVQNIPQRVINLEVQALLAVSFETLEHE